MDTAGKSVFVQRDENSAKAKAAEMIRQLQGRFARGCKKVCVNVFLRQ